MYLKYWNLNEEPFRQIATDRMVFMSMQYREGLARLFYLFDQKRTAGMITGPYGVGKTLTFEFLRRRALRDKAQVIQIDAIPNGSLPMARHILRCLGLPDAASTLAEALMTLQVHARQSVPRLKHHAPREVLRGVDEAGRGWNRMGGWSRKSGPGTRPSPRCERIGDAPISAGRNPRRNDG